MTGLLLLQAIKRCIPEQIKDGLEVCKARNVNIIEALGHNGMPSASCT